MIPYYREFTSHSPHATPGPLKHREFPTQGKLVALTGLAGSGKSRLLNMLAGDVEPSFGRVLVPSHLRFLLVTHQVFVMLG